jgi:hypothetical protein
MSNAKELAKFARDITYDTANTELSGITVLGAGGNSFSTITIDGQSNVVADGTNDTLTLVAGTGITLTTNSTTDTITISGNATANTFSSIAVSGQSSVIADNTSDTLTLVAGSNVTITTDAANDTITIAAQSTGGGGQRVATSYLQGTVSTNSSTRWYPVQNITIDKCIARLLTAGQTSVIVAVSKNGVSQYQLTIGNTIPVENNTDISVGANDYITVDVLNDGIGAQDLYVSFLYTAT